MNITLGSNAELAAQREVALRRLAKQAAYIGRNGAPSISDMISSLGDATIHDPERMTALMLEIKTIAGQYRGQNMKPYTDMNIPELQRAALRLQAGQIDEQGMTREDYVAHAGDLQRNLYWGNSPLPPSIYEPPMRWRYDWEYNEDWTPRDGVGREGWSGAYWDDYEADAEAAALGRMAGKSATRGDCRIYTRYTNFGRRAVYRLADAPAFYVFAPQDGGDGYYLVEKTESYKQARAVALAG